MRSKRPSVRSVAKKVDDRVAFLAAQRSRRRGEHYILGQEGGQCRSVAGVPGPHETVQDSPFRVGGGGLVCAETTGGLLVCDSCSGALHRAVHAGDAGLEDLLTCQRSPMYVPMAPGPWARSS
jgi:hypothetical protein